MLSSYTNDNGKYQKYWKLGLVGFGKKMLAGQSPDQTSMANNMANSQNIGMELSFDQTIS